MVIAGAGIGGLTAAVALQRRGIACTIIEAAPRPAAINARASGLADSQVASDDRMIPPPAQRAMAERIGSQTVEVAGSATLRAGRQAYGSKGIPAGLV